jgi:hypothetical protein
MTNAYFLLIFIYFKKTKKEYLAREIKVTGCGILIYFDDLWEKEKLKYKYWNNRK